MVVWSIVLVQRFNYDNCRIGLFAIGLDTYWLVVLIKSSQLAGMDFSNGKNWNRVITVESEV
jgi:hypothetical protein